MLALAFDIEGDGLLPELTTCWCVGIADVKTPHEVQSYSNHDDNLPSLEEGLARLLVADRLVAHNGIGYDVPAIKKLFGLDLPIGKVWDTMTVGGFLDPERRSIALGGYGADLGYPKGDHTDWLQYSQEMRIYMERDVTITALLYVKQQRAIGAWLAKGVDVSQALALELGVQRILSRQSNHGFKFDVDAAQALDTDLRTEMSALEVELQNQFPPRWVPEKAVWCFRAQQWTQAATFTPAGSNKAMGYTAGAPLSKIKQELFNPGSRVQISTRLSHSYGWSPTTFTPAGTVSVDESTLRDLPFAPAQVMCRYLRLSKQIGMLSEGKNAWLRLEQNGRLHGYVRSCGARTHRMSHSRPNLAQVDKEPRMRSLFTADPGHVLVGADASGLELRLMAAYLFTVDGGQYADSVLHGSNADGTDVHSINQRLIGLKSRDAAKTFFYAFLYGAGNGKLGQVIIDDHQAAGVPAPKGRPEVLGSAARKRLQAGIKGLDALINHAAQVASKRGYMTLPDGRPVMSAARTSLNSLLQGAGAVLMKKALVIFDQDLAEAQNLQGHFEYVANVHDEVQLTCEPDYADRVGQAVCDSIRLAGEALGYKVPFAGEYSTGLNWSETH